MKKLLVALLAIGCQTAFSNVIDIPAGAIERKLLFMLTPKDAYKCGDNVIGDHTANANVERVTVRTNDSLFVYEEMTDGVGFSYTCSEKQSQKLPNYFDKIVNGLKYKNLERVWGNLEQGGLRCFMDNEDQLSDATLLQKHPYLVINKIYGSHKLSTYQSNPIKWSVATTSGKTIASCDAYTASISKLPLRAKTLDNYSDTAQINEFIQKIKEHREEQETTVLGFCTVTIKRHYNEPLIAVEAYKDVFNNNKRLLATQYLKQTEAIKSVEEVITNENCLITK